MNYSEYQKQRAAGELLTLPSGLEVRVKKITLMDLAFNGEIPTTLHPLTDQMLEGKSDVAITAADFAQYGGLINLIVKACLLSPKVGEVSGEDTIALEDLGADDKIAIFRWSNRGAAALEKFRQESPGALGDLQSNGHEPRATIVDPRD